MNAIPRERRTRTDLDRISMLDWLREKRQTDAAMERYWRKVLVRAVNGELARMGAGHGFQVFWLGMIARADSYEMGIPDIPLRELYDEKSLARTGSVRIEHRSSVTSIQTVSDSVCTLQTSRGPAQADFYISTL